MDDADMDGSVPGATAPWFLTKVCICMATCKKYLRPVYCSIRGQQEALTHRNYSINIILGQPGGLRRVLLNVSDAWGQTVPAQVFSAHVVLQDLRLANLLHRRCMHSLVGSVVMLHDTLYLIISMFYLKIPLI